MFTKSQDERGTDPAMGGSRGGAGGQRSVLASDLHVNGTIATEGTLEVHGHVEGEIVAAILLIGHEGAVAGKVQAGQAELRGQLMGEIACAQLTLRAAARMQADATCATLVIESGAEVEGHFARPAPPPAAKPAASPAPQAGAAPATAEAQKPDGSEKDAAPKAPDQPAGASRP